MMKRILIIMLIALLVIGLVGCGKARQNAQEQAIENMIENMMEAGNENVDVDIDSDGDSINITSDEGKVSIQGDEDGMPWPSDKLPSYVPEVKGVKVVSVVDVGEGVYIIFDGVDSKIAEDYIKAMENNGWENTWSLDSEGVHQYVSSNSSDEMLQFGWNEEDGSGEITFGQE